MNIEFSDTIERYGYEWAPWQTLEVDYCPPGCQYPPTWQAALERVTQECERALVPFSGSMEPCLIEGCMLYLERSAAERVIEWRRANAMTKAQGLGSLTLSAAEQQAAYAALEGFSLSASSQQAGADAESL